MVVLKLATRSVTLELRVQVLELLHPKAFGAKTISSCYDTRMITNVIKSKIYWICIKRTSLRFLTKTQCAQIKKTPKKQQLTLLELHRTVLIFTKGRRRRLSRKRRRIVKKR